MKLASFFVLSVSLHAAALLCPISFHGLKQERIMRATILPVARESQDAGGRGRNGNPASQTAAKSAGRAPRTVQPVSESTSTGDPEPQTLSGEGSAKFSASSAVLVSPIANSAETNSTAILGSIGNDGNGSRAGASGFDGNGFGSSGTVSGLGNGQGSSGNGAILIQARYNETPKPVYPASARREGREGRVLLRVLIDDQGKTRSVEINRSSGSDALDQAATEAIKLWRFHPARAGDRPVESWVSVPIEFQLKDSRN